MENRAYKRIILIDLDGVLNEYTGSFDKDFIPPAKSGAKEFLNSLHKNYEIKLFTTRNKVLASKWLIENDLDTVVTDVTSTKELCYLFVDDRTLTFEGDYGDLTEKIECFKPWYKSAIKQT